MYSAGLYLDILPRVVNKGATLKRLVEHLSMDPERVLVAGDTLNDLAMYQQPFKGVCVAESEPALLEATQSDTFVLHATARGCGGLLQAITHLDRTSVVEGKSVSVRVDLGGRLIIKNTK